MSSPLRTLARGIARKNMKNAGYSKVAKAQHQEDRHPLTGRRIIVRLPSLFAEKWKGFISRRRAK